MKIEFHYDFGSPNAYLVHSVVPDISRQTGIEFNYVPVLLGGVFKATNNVSPAVSMQGIKNKPEYQAVETQRFCETYGVLPYTHNPYFPLNTLQIMRGAVYAEYRNYYETYINVVYDAIWQQKLQMDELDIIAATLESAGLPYQDILEGMNDPAIKQKLISNTENSVSWGNFGSPTFFVGDEMFFGKDKLRDAIEFFKTIH